LYGFNSRYSAKNFVRYNLKFFTTLPGQLNNSPSPRRMTDKTKRVFLASTIIVPFLAYCMYYYGHMFKVAPYKLSEFKSFIFKYGYGDSLINQYNSETGAYQYVNKHDSLIKTTLKLTPADIDSLHRNAGELGFWDFPSNEMGRDTPKLKGTKPPRYYIEFNYKRKSKKVLFDASFNTDVRLTDANKRMVTEILKVLDDAEVRNKK
jgi:hypothetical protein